MSLICRYVGFIFMSFLSSGFSLPQTVKIGAIFQEDDTANYLAFVKALEILQKERLAPSYVFRPSVKWIKVKTDSFKTYFATCNLIEEGVIAIFGPANPFTSPTVASITSRFNVPHIEYMFRRVDDAALPPTTVNVYPDSQAISDALADLLEAMDWAQYTVVYESNDGLSRLQKLLMRHGPKDFPITVRQLTPNYDNIRSEADYRPVLKEVANSTDFNVIFDIEPKTVPIVLKQAQEVKLLKEYYNFLFTCWHCPMEPIVETLNKSNANVTVIQMLSNKAAEYGITTMESALIFDAVFLLHDALELFKKRYQDREDILFMIDPPSLSCEDVRKYNIGPNISSLMREVATAGPMSGPMIFGENGGRSFKLIFTEYYGKSAFESGYWEHGNLTLIRTQKEREEQSLQSIEQKHFRVTTKEVEPYIMEVKDESTRGVFFPNDNKRFEGYAIDLIHELSEQLNFQYTFELVPDNEYGVYNKDTKQYNGLIGRLLSREADLAICDFTITKQRESAVDFTMPFMNLGISILFAKPESKEPELFSFLLPFSTDVWIYMATAYIAVSVLIFVQARIAPAEWTAPHPCNNEPEELENSFTLMNCLWLTAGSLVQQGSDILPRAPSVRFAASMWWFFVLIMVSSYTANLAAFLTATKMDVSISNVEELAAQNKIKYGAVGKGSTASYFSGSNVSMYKRMWQTMVDAKPSVLTKNNNEGVDRVAKSKRTYAFLMESTGIEYAIERNCELMQVGSLLDNKGYGIAMPPNSPYRKQLNEAILKLQENSVLKDLKDKWWLRGSKNCSAREPPPSSGELTMANLGGVFLVLIFGLLFGIFFAIIECVWNLRKVAVAEKITPWEAFVAEAKFGLNLTARTKPVKMSKTSKSSSGSSAGDFIKGASRDRSVIGSFIRLDNLGRTGAEEECSSSHRRNTLPE